MSVSETTSKAPQLTSKEATKNKRTNEAENERNIVRKTTVVLLLLPKAEKERMRARERRSPGSTFGARSLANAAAEKQTSKRSERTM